MNKSKLNKDRLSVLVIAIILLAGLWVIIIHPFLKFHQNESAFKSAAERYFELNKQFLPQEGNVTTVSGLTLYDKKFIGMLSSAYSSSECDLKESWVKVKRDKGEYKYYTYLKCGLIRSRVDHKGPVITLKGNENLEIERGENFTDPGIKSVRDNTDGDMDTKKVIIKSDVDTSKIGEYKITYSISDSFENKSVVTRVVHVIQCLDQTVKKDTKDGIYKGLVENNYIRFSGQLFRIVGITDDGNVKIVSNEDISQLDYKSVHKWLNEYYYNHLSEESKKYIVDNYKWCSDTASNTEVDRKIDCKVKKNKENVGLLSINEYNSSLKEGESYLYTNTINWTSTNESDKKAWATKNMFLEQESKYLDYSVGYHFNVRPSMVLKKNTKILDGDGTISNPYDIGDFRTGKAGTKINKRYSGEYINYGSVLYRIVEVEDGYTKVVTDKVLNGAYEFGDGDTYNPEKSGNIGYIIENTVGNYTKTGLFTKHTIKVPIYENKSTYIGKKTEKEYNVKFAAPNLYEMYSSGENPFWYMNSSKKSTVKYLCSANGTVYYDIADRIHMMNGGIKYTGYLNKNVSIVSGNGTKDNPYKISD